ncbi:hypothetical protein [Aliiroseovarius marinus]|uniref:hypothetical protein n=1 Tax=Aliiroseovarius marinus TaxID=2500159 RepID=UPI003D7C5FE7
MPRLTHLAPLALLAALALAATALRADTDPLQDALAGKTFYGKSDTTITLHEDGKLTGGNDKMQIEGTWSVENGTYCRDITSPDFLAGKGCPAVSFDGDLVTFTRADGSARSYQMK